MKSVKLKPKLSYHFWWYCLGVLLAPLLGYGVYLILKKRRELQAVTYRITDDTITIEEVNYRENVDLVNIHSAEIEQRWMDERFGIGTVILKTDSREVKLKGVEQPERLSDMILQAAAAIRERLKNEQKRERSIPDRNAGSLDKMDYLTGLWQQGLITNEEYEKERRHFEG